MSKELEFNVNIVARDLFDANPTTLRQQEYVRNKYKIDGIGKPCSCKGNQMCGQCFWNGISIPPERCPQCMDCKQDDKNRRENRKKENYIDDEYELICCTQCAWHSFYCDPCYCKNSKKNKKRDKK